MAHRLGPAVTVQPMIAEGVEISVGVVRDPAFGPLLVVAAGGTLVELLDDRAVALPPLSQPGALRLLGGLRIRALLAGWRGGAPADLMALADVIVAFSSLATELGDAIEAVEANPVIVSADGAVAVDALLVVRGGIGE
jgi:acyl-CoA synthetase (NDP forming)